MTTGDTEYRDLLPVIIETTGSTLPDGFDSWTWSGRSGAPSTRRASRT